MSDMKIWTKSLAHGRYRVLMGRLFFSATVFAV